MTAARKTSVCLNMIVKNEAPTIVRALNSAKPLLSHWVIVDTGSTDGTQDIIRETMKDIPGTLHERPWKDFAHNRNEAIELAAGTADYLLILDADDEFEIGPRYALPKLTQDAYELMIQDMGTAYARLHFFRPDSGLRYQGVLHEVLTTARPFSIGRLPEVVYRRNGGGARSRDPKKYEKDAATLEAAFATEPNNARYAFYLAQSYKDMNAPAKALKAYEKRASMGGWEEEVYHSLLEVARQSELLKREDDEIQGAYVRAYESRPSRAEPMCFLAIYLRAQGRPKAAYPFARVAAETPRPTDHLYVDESVYSWRSLDEFAVASFAIGRFADSAAANERLLANKALPPPERDRVKRNADRAREQIKTVLAAHPELAKQAQGGKRRR